MKYSIVICISFVLLSLSCVAKDDDKKNGNPVEPRLTGTASLAFPGKALSGGSDAAYGTIDNPIIDSAMTFKEAVLDKKPWDCTNNEALRQVLVDVYYYSFDGKVHKGQIVIHRDFFPDIQEVFYVMYTMRFPIYSAVPVRNDEILKNPRNTSGFSYRNATGRDSLSKHAFGRAIDINPYLNPYINYRTVIPNGGSYNPRMPGTLTPDHPVVLKFKELGWKWGGDFKNFKDYQHFQK
jgi:hypothetical protein